VFCHHKQVAAALIEEFKDICTVVTGLTGLQERHDNVEKFQTDPNCRLFIGNIIAAGTGITLTASSHVVFAELDWVPGNVSQAEDRCHRMGQTGSVLVQHIVVAGSIDAIMAKTIVYKQSVIEKALDPNAEADLERALQ
jgi:SWI/SNF-related matrix-associated actin-dependent regulator 1 of chromatin subfamily A